MKQNLRSSVWKCCVVTLLSISTYCSSFGQNSESSSFLEAGITVGPSNFLGDLGGHMGKGTTFLKDNNIPLTKLMIGAFLGYQPNEWLGFRLMASYGTLEGDDNIIKGKGGMEETRRVRNSNFRSKLIEGLFMVELYPTVFFEYDQTDIFHKLRPYGVIGVGAFNFNPQGTDPLSGEWVNLKDLHTEGQGFAEFPERKEYKLTQMNIPMGVGVKYFLSESVNLSLEVVHRKTFTDYIDDVSTVYVDPDLFYWNMPTAKADLAKRMANKTGDQLGNNTVYVEGNKRGTATNNDAYYSVHLKLGVRLGSSSDRRWRNSTSCPIRF